MKHIYSKVQEAIYKEMRRITGVGFRQVYFNFSFEEKGSQNAQKI